jgi:hypothetical protein
MKNFWQFFYTVAGVGAIIYAFLYWNEVLAVDNITQGMYCLGFGLMCLGEALRR